ncbi:uncharacterized protein LOC111272888 [Varroa jacobsoni]|uniref:Uncharacterized protein n=1 Tax=Varroa destructor TaxID=109461 RepID=A0A7M7KDI1_VARDE|nr:uncharacterized protein LOC111252077 [Varroa destructor]XP_022665202.1 uncharacterized protein LOC111252077 [Varroa destructor]XP_022665203.1 uncharacterized protein LOC111252077 [Varroa destructor]XP_022665204.1 uncharacterized protein LOC111252077 [Varroa destructor]XP_022665205.1 uncharacterized protein LOC111252077 [Varroa destructor]XP_022665206.1 uncharacterized protein LOC111252077 [Varroa destructor]XP_022665207.1 uncharacterized protein LOC111252077 [Varroa destructor]XP_02266520
MEAKAGDVMLFSCGCLNVELRCDSTATSSFEDDHLRSALGGQLILLERPQKRVVHEWLLREKHGIRHCFACNTPVFSFLASDSQKQQETQQEPHQEQPQALVVSNNLRRDETWISDLRRHPSFSECFQILVDPTIAHTQLAGLQENAEHGPHKEDSLVPGYIEGVRSKVSQVVKQVMAEKQYQIEEEHRRALDSLRQLKSKCDLQCNTLLKIIEYQETAEERRFSTATTKSSSFSVARSESMESKASQRSGGFGLRDRESSGSGGITGTAGFDDDVFEMQFNDEAIYEDGEGGIEQAEEAREMGAEGDGDEQFDDDDEVVSALSQERTRRSSMDLTQYAASAPIQVPVDAANWASLRPEEEGLDAREPSLARPECLEDIARSMRDISDRMVDDHTKVFGDLPRPRLYTNQF